jgi:hypothetical protein
LLLVQGAAVHEKSATFAHHRASEVLAGLDDTGFVREHHGLNAISQPELREHSTCVLTVALETTRGSSGSRRARAPGRRR